MRPRILLIDGIGRAPCYSESRAALDAEWLLELTPAIEREAASTIDLAIVRQENHARSALALCRLIERGSYVKIDPAWLPPGGLVLRIGWRSFAETPANAIRPAIAATGLPE